MTEKLLSPKELADALGKSIKTVYQMRRVGFRMSGFRATLSEARQWLDIHPHPFAMKPVRPLFSANMGIRKEETE